MHVDLDAPVSQGVFGGLVGLAQPAVAGLVAAGVLREGAPACEWIASYARHLRDLAHGRGGDVADSRRRLLVAQSERVELEVRTRHGEVCAVAEVRRAAGRAAALLGRELDGLPMRVAPRVVGLSLTEIARALDDAQRELRARVCAELARDDSTARAAAHAMAAAMDAT